jgi:hypothetical protein
MRVLARIAMLLLLWGCSGSDILKLTRPLADLDFARRCAELAGLTVYAPAERGGVLSDNPNLGQNLWLLFDVGADFVEFDRRVWEDDAAFVAEWGTFSIGPAIWRLERKPAGDAACTIFDRWLTRLAQPGSNAMSMSERWRNRASYRGQCLAVSIRPASETRADGASYDAPLVYYLHSDGASLGNVGSRCYLGSDRRSTLVGRWGRRILELRTLGMAESNRCVIAHRPNLATLATCGDPNDTDLVRGHAIFYGHTRADRLDRELEDQRCSDAGACWRQPAAVVRNAEAHL